MHDEMADILIVEDSDEDAEIVGRVLRKAGLLNPMYRVRDGREAVNYVLRRGEHATRPSEPQLILLDLKLPGVDGLEVLRALKAHSETATVPVIVLTSSLHEKSLIDSYQLGAVGYLTKPVAFSAFVEVVAKVGLHWAVVSRAAEKILF